MNDTNKSLHDIHSHHARDRRKVSAGSEHRQTEAFRKMGKRLAFAKCGNCGAAQLYVPYEPTFVGWQRWCYECGAKDEQTYPEGSVVRAKSRLDKMTLGELRALYAQLIREKGE